LIQPDQKSPRSTLKGNMNDTYPASPSVGGRPIAAAYARSPTHALELQPQLEAIRARAAADGYSVPADLEFTDLSGSRLDADRPGLRGLLSAIRTDGRIQRLYARHPVCIPWSDPLDPFLDELRDHGVEVRFLEPYVPRRRREPSRFERRARRRQRRGGRPMRFGASFPVKGGRTPNSPVNPNGGPA
jgi:hypothetical protein